MDRASLTSKHNILINTSQSGKENVIANLKLKSEYIEIAKGLSRF